ncbi:branched-chain alpha-ketoacid dehydrogenase, partial [Chytriomyces cf. hyalinus JEL632]
NHRNFYQNSIVEKYAARESKLVTLRQLTVFGRHLTLDKLLRSANYVREELPVRLAHRIIDIQHLPFIVGTNPHIQLIYSLYWQAFEAFRLFPEIKTIEQNRQFCRLIESQLQTHLVIIPQLAMGMAEASTPEHMSAETADRFLNEMLRSRIGRRVLAEQHIALSDTYEQGLTSQDPSKRHNGNLSVVDEEEEDGWIGIVNTRCRAGEVVERVSALAKRWFIETSPNRNIEPPEVKIDGHANAVFTYIPDHIEYILFELLKNSMRFTLETHAPVSKASPPLKKLPPIVVTVGASRNDITFRVSDQGGGFAHTQMANLWSYTHASRHAFLTNLSNMPKLAGKNTVANAAKGPFELEERSLHLGLGLPMSRVYANYWGGTIGVHSMHGYGTDAYVKISLGNQLENL